MGELLHKLTGYLLPIYLVQSIKLKSKVVIILIFSLTSSLTGQVQISTSPTSLSVELNQAFSVTVAVETSQFVDAAEVHMSFDSNIIEVTSVNIPQASPFPVPIIQPNFNNAIGVINYAGGTFSSFPNADFVFLEIQFTAKALGKTNLEFLDPINGLASKATFGGYNILTGVTGSTINVHDIDTTAPIITLIGDDTINLSVGDIYTELGANAIDDTDDDISEKVTIGGDLVDTNTVGQYIVTYDVMDAAGNPALQVTRTVNVSQVGGNSYTITANPGPNGTIDPSTTTVNQGANILFTITPNAGYQVENVFVNGNSVGPLTAYEFTNVQGTATISATFIESVPTTLAITGFTLINADTDQDIMPLTDGQLINATTYATTNLAIKANTTSDVRSVHLLLSGNKTRNQTESVAPFTLFGDNLPTNDFFGELFAEGNYSLTASPYGSVGLNGSQGTPKTISFKFTNQNPICSNFNASIGNATNPSGCNINDGSIEINTVGFQGPLTYNWSHNPNLNASTANGLAAGTYSVTVTDVNGCTKNLSITLNGPTPPSVTLASFADVLVTDSPIALSGGNPSGGVYSGPGVSKNIFDPSIGSGIYAIVYTYEDINGCVNSATKTIQVGSPIANASVIVVDANTDLALFPLTNGMQIDKNTIGNSPLGIIYNADLNPGNVFFKLTGPINQNKSEGPSAPYSLFGDIGIDIQGKPFPIGNYTLVTSTTSGVQQTFNFAVVSGPPANVPPVVSLVGNTDNAVPYKINFSSAGSTDNDGRIASYSWDFGDGNTSTEQNPSHTYSVGGSYIISLTLTDDDGATSTKSISVTAVDPTINQPPIVVASASPTIGAAPLLVNFSSSGSNDADGAIVSYEWNFGDGNTSSLLYPSNTYNTPGSYNVSLTLTDDDNATSIKNISITVLDPIANQAPIAVARATPAIGTAPLIVAFSSSGSSDADGSIVSYEWNFGDGGTSTQANPSHTYVNPGNYVSTLTITDDEGANDIVSVQVKVNEPDNNAALFILNANNDTQLYTLTNGLQISKTDIGNTPLGIIFNPDLNPGYVYFTLTGPINQSKSEGPSAPYSLFGDIGIDIQGKPFPVGNYTLVARPSVGAVQTVNFSVVSGPPGNANPIAVATGNPDPNTAFKLNFSSAGSMDTDGNVVGYSWNFGDGNSSTLQNPTHTYSTAGPKTVTLSVTDDKGGVGTTSIQVTAVDPNDVDKVVSFTLINAIDNSQLHALENNVNITDGNNINIRANTDPEIVGSVKFELSGAITRTWIETSAPYALFGDTNGDYTSINLPVGAYTLKATPYTLGGASGNAGQSLIINFNVGQPVIAAKASVNSMVISPNPANESVAVSFDEPTQLTQIYVYDISGRLVKSLRMDPNKDLGSYLLGVQELPSGSYFVRTIDSKGKELQQQMAIKR
ncbi:PKD domain-containing protein [Arenibacter certesii]|uniref:PKD domain-containing protein n=1 Tax=Arenibacter certesii TaxID=228955 RepID=A0A918IVK4_9FLAO|nr:PKD domain-containing protein [Arenibacter certesii]GGW32916.1 hypothetical protein GCM10007383_17340 [Arenibacter certesii]